jgi:hypothetical protein
VETSEMSEAAIKGNVSIGNLDISAINIVCINRKLVFTSKRSDPVSDPGLASRSNWIRIHNTEERRKNILGDLKICEKTSL